MAARALACNTGARANHGIRAMTLTLEQGLRIGIQTIHRRTEPAAG